MKKQMNPNVLTGIAGGIALFILAMLPIGIQLMPTRLDAMVAPVATPSADVLVLDYNQDAPVAVAQPQGSLVEYTLRTKIGGNPAMAYVGEGGAIDGVVNPVLEAKVGDTVRITIINGDPVLHDLKIDAFGVASEHLTAAEQSTVVEFVATRPGEFEYYCSIPGHKATGMKGVLRVTGGEETVATGGQPAAEVQTVAASANVLTAAPAAADAVSIVRNPADVPPPVGDRGPMHVRVDLTTMEVNGVLADGTTYRFMTFDGKIPGPMLRVRVGDTIEIHLKNASDSHLPHSIDFHAATGPGGGAAFTQTNPGEETSFTFKALQPGLYVYHCATPSIAHHIASGMYGLILVEPEGGLPPVDKEFYIMQGELYTAQPYGTQGHVDFSHEKMLNEDAEYFMFNGAAGALTTDEYAMRTEVGDTVRLFFGVGGPNAVSSLHLIGEIFDKVYDQASLTSPPLTDVQTTLVAPGGATMVEFTIDVPGRFVLVDHALSRLERGLAGYLYAEGAENPEIFHGEGEANMAGH